jgi:hypothetical protein
MHIEDLARQQQLKKLTIEMAAQVIKRRQELAGAGTAARDVWLAMLESPTWQVAIAPKPPGPWKEPEEIWSETTKIVKK